MPILTFVVAAAIVGVAAFLAGLAAGRVMSVDAAVTEAEQRRVATEQAARERDDPPPEQLAWRVIAAQGAVPQPVPAVPPTAAPAWPLPPLPTEPVTPTPDVPAAVPVKTGRHHATEAMHAVAPKETAS